MTRIYLNIVGDTIDLGSPLNPIENGRLLIIPGAAHRGCLNLRQAAYMTVRKGATLNLANISIVVNGAEPRSIIDNDGGTLAYQPTAPMPVFFPTSREKSAKRRSVAFCIIETAASPE